MDNIAFENWNIKIKHKKHTLSVEIKKTCFIWGQQFIDVHIFVGVKETNWIRTMGQDGPTEYIFMFSFFYQNHEAIYMYNYSLRSVYLEVVKYIQIPGLKQWLQMIELWRPEES